MASNKAARLEGLNHPGRAKEIVLLLAREFRLAPELVEEAVGAAVAAAARCLGRAAATALVSWFPCSWRFIRPDDFGVAARAIPPVRGRDWGAAEEMAVAAAAHGVPGALAPRFAALLEQLIGERCGSPLARALRWGRGRGNGRGATPADGGISGAVRGAGADGPGPASPSAAARISAGAEAAGPSGAAPRPRAARPSSPPPDGAFGPSGRRCR